MPRFYFHLCAPDQVFADNMGSDLSDLSAAHARALILADRMMMIFGSLTGPPISGGGRWTSPTTAVAHYGKISDQLSAWKTQSGCK
jgi:hypothetical protein